MPYCTYKNKETGEEVDIIIDALNDDVKYVRQRALDILSANTKVLKALESKIGKIDCVRFQKTDDRRQMTDDRRQIATPSS